MFNKFAIGLLLAVSFGYLTAQINEGLVNGIVDGVLAVVRRRIASDGYDPLPLPPYEIKLLGLGFVGKLELNDCQLYNLSTLYRSADVDYETINKTLAIQTAINFDQLKINCTYRASLLSIGLKKGKVEINVPKLTAQADMGYSLSNRKMTLNDLALSNEGPLDVHLEGGLLDALVSLLTEAISNLFKGVILGYTESLLEDEIREILEASKLSNEEHSALKNIFGHQPFN